VAVNDLAPLLQGFFSDRLIRQRQASPHTIAAYRDAIILLLGFVQQQTGRQPATLSIADLDAETVAAFLAYLETERGNTTSTRNARLAAVHSLFRYAALRDPDHAALIQRVLAIPPKRSDRAILGYLTREECDALIAAPDQTSKLGRRDHALLHLAIHTGLRLSELTGLTRGDVHLGTGPHVRCHGKGRKDRCTPLTRPTAKILASWLRESPGRDDDPLFPSSRGGRLSSDAVQRLVAKHAAAAVSTCPSLAGKAVTPHTLRHSTAMALLHAGVDLSVIALWLGHESTDVTQIYLHADMTIKENALARLPTPRSSRGRYRPTDKLLDYLNNL
jgi:integrase/recombinase XerD